MIKSNHPNPLRRSEILESAYHELLPCFTERSYQLERVHRSFICEDETSHKEFAVYLLTINGNHYLDFALLLRHKPLHELFDDFSKAGGQIRPGHTAATNISSQLGIRNPYFIFHQKDLKETLHLFKNYLVNQGLRLMEELANPAYLANALNRDPTTESPFVNNQNRPFTAVAMACLAKRPDWQLIARQHLEACDLFKQSSHLQSEYLRWVKFLEKALS